MREREGLIMSRWGKDARAEGGGRTSLWVMGEGGGRALDRLNIDTVNEKRRESIYGYVDHRRRLACLVGLIGSRRMREEKESVGKQLGNQSLRLRLIPRDCNQILHIGGTTSTRITRA